MALADVPCAVRPNNLADRPWSTDDRATDILADLLASLRLDDLVYGRIELGAPWGLRFPDLATPSASTSLPAAGAQLDVEHPRHENAQTTVLAGG